MKGRIPILFTASGIPQTGLSPLITIHNLSLLTTPIAGDQCTEYADGMYYYDIQGYNENYTYTWKIDGGNTLSGVERYIYGGNGNYVQDIASSLNDTLNINSGGIFDPAAVWNQKYKGKAMKDWVSEEKEEEDNEIYTDILHNVQMIPMVVAEDIGRVVEAIATLGDDESERIKNVSSLIDSAKEEIKTEVNTGNEMVKNEIKHTFDSLKNIIDGIETSVLKYIAYIKNFFTKKLSDIETSIDVIEIKSKEDEKEESLNDE